MSTKLLLLVTAVLVFVSGCIEGVASAASNDAAVAQLMPTKDEVGAFAPSGTLDQQTIDRVSADQNMIRAEDLAREMTAGGNEAQANFIISADGSRLDPYVMVVGTGGSWKATWGKGSTRPVDGTTTELEIVPDSGGALPRYVNDGGDIVLVKEVDGKNYFTHPTLGWKWYPVE